MNKLCRNDAAFFTGVTELQIISELPSLDSRIFESLYIPQGDYTRVIASFLADGPDSETSPNHLISVSY